jgi:hypothetical protein
LTRTIGYVCLTAAILIGALGLPAVANPARLTMQPSHTKVGVAKVKLLVTDLVLQDDSLVGSYRITIPMAPWRNDEGELHLFPDEPLEQTLAGGGVVNGHVLSHENGRTHPVTCRFEADGTVDITVTTHERTLAFKTRVGGEL